jgi:ribosomal-protein-alanine N-acetyltransferase
MFLEVGESNVPAVGLYRTCGFSPVGRRPDYYRDSEGRRETAVIMARTLDLRA